MLKLAALLMGTFLFIQVPAASADDTAAVRLEDGEFFQLPKTLDPSQEMRLKREGAQIFLLRGSKKVLLGELGDPDTGNGPDICALDINFDGAPEFMIREIGGNIQSIYFLVDSNGQRDLAKQLFSKAVPTGSLASAYLEDMVGNAFELFEFNAKARTLKFIHRGGASAMTETYGFQGGKYMLIEQTFPFFSTRNDIALEIRKIYVKGVSPRESVRYDGDATNAPVRGRAAVDALCYKKIPASSEEKQAQQANVPTGTALVVREVGHAKNVDEGAWAFVEYDKKHGWVKMEDIELISQENAQAK